MDDWEGEEHPEYDPSKYYTRATDGKGHKETIWVSVPPNIANALATIVQSRTVPAYRTVQDIVRDAIYHRLHYLSQVGATDNSTKSLLGFEEAMQQALFHQERMMQYEANFERMKNVVINLLSDLEGGREEAKRVVTAFWNELSSVTDNTYWRNKYLTRLRKEFGHLIEEEGAE